MSWAIRWDFKWRLKLSVEANFHWICGNFIISHSSMIAKVMDNHQGTMGSIFTRMYMSHWRMVSGRVVDQHFSMLHIRSRLTDGHIKRWTQHLLWSGSIHSKPVCTIDIEVNSLPHFFNCRPKTGQNYYSISNYMVLIRQNKRGQNNFACKVANF